MPWRSVELSSNPKIAVFRDDGYVQPTPPVKRALEETVAKLKAKGYEIIEWSNECHLEIYQLLGKLFVADGGKSVEKILEPSAEPWRPELKMYQDATEMGVHELWQIQAQRTALAKKYLDRWAAVEGLDAILGPTTPYASPKNGQFRHVGYTAVFNVLDYSSSSFPSGVYVDKEKDVVAEGAKTHSEVDAQTQKEYDPVLSHGLPVSLQLTGRRLQEEKILALTEKIVEDLKS
jgi:amidase